LELGLLAARGKFLSPGGSASFRLVIFFFLTFPLTTVFFDFGPLGAFVIPSSVPAPFCNVSCYTTAPLFRLLF